MASKSVAIIVIIAVAVCAVGGAAFFITNNGNDGNQAVYSISYELNGGSADQSSPASYTEGSTVDLGTPTRSSGGYDYTFLGWYTDSDLTQKIDKITSDVKGDIKLYASWKDRSYAISYELNGGIADEKSPSSYVYGFEVDLGTPTRYSDDCDYTFLGWYTDSALTQKIEKITSTTEGDLKLYASWSGPVYTITYQLNGGTADPNSPSSYISGSEVGLGMPTRSSEGHDYLFKGWYTDSALTQKIEKITSFTEGNLELYASWAGPIYGIIYELNGGTADEGSPSTYVCGEATDLGCPVRTDMTFMGWYLDEECTENLLYIDKDVSGDLVLYALWDDTIVGHGFRYDLTVVQTLYSSTTYSGYYECTYLNTDDERGSLRHTVLYLKDAYGRVSSSDDTEWNSGDDDYTETVEDDIIMTIDGWTFVCDKVIFEAKDGSSEEIQYIIYDWLPVKIESITKNGSTTVNYEYDLSDILSVDVIESCTITVYSQDGISVTYPATCGYGFSAELTAEADEGKTFKGWYDASGTLLSSESTYSIDMLLSDTVLYVYSTSDYDFKYSTELQFSLDTDLSDPVWVLMNDNGVIIDTQNSDTFTYDFTSMSEFTLCLSGNDGTVNKFYRLIVDYVLTKTYDWTFNDVDYSVTLNIDYSDYYHYLSDDIARKQGTMSHNMEFITYDDKYVVQIAEYINDATSALSDEERVNVLLCFTQTLPYMYDSYSKGQDEYWKYPLETLYEYNGDCEDTSILFCAIGTAMGYDTAFMLFSGHAVAAINIEELGYSVEDNVRTEQVWSLFGSSYCYYFDNDGETTYAYRDSVYDGSRYYLYCETTIEDYVIGDVPKYDWGTYSSSRVQSVCPIISGVE